MMSTPVIGDRYWRGFGFGLIVAFLAFLAWKTSGEPWCAPSAPSWLPWAEPEEHCVRERISALAGWGAVIVALPTVRMLAKQIRDADQFHKQTIAMAMEKQLILASRTRRRVNNEQRRIDRIKANIANMNASAGSTGHPTMLTQATAKMVVKLAENFDERDFDEFENITFVGATYLRSVRKALGAAQQIASPASKTSGGTTLSARDLNRIDNAVTRAQTHAKRLEEHAKRYLKRWEG
ncbi:hypothetical protein J2T08_003626 [Neorhizobium galegae]|uniref:hypothetical protein n=1 Tax=Neorhizobium galegae TaxID=399 RepID=UPI002783751F|nr:hypothetical protein [Neorhizobium galegae]MDQ0135705.1 hypothetical protein [Neorhizobium galegae]